MIRKKYCGTAAKAGGNGENKQCCEGRRVFLKTAAVGTGALAILLVAGPLFADDRPNILYIFTDDQSSRTVSCYPEAHPWVSTPNIDKLAEQGVRFDTVYMGPYCVASRISQLTGNLPHAARGQFNNKKPLVGEELEEEVRRHPFWLQRLRESGYHTGMIGKWHLYARMPAIGVDWDYAAYWHKKINNAYYYDQRISINGAEPVPLNGYSVDRHTDLAIDYITERAASDQPWLLWLCYSSPHNPQIPAKRHQGKFTDITDIPIPTTFALPRAGKPNYVQKMPLPEISDIQDLVKRYHECVLSIDENVGRLTKALRKTGQLENTVIIFTSDQGLAMGHHGHVKKKAAPYNATLNSPLIFRYPKQFLSNIVNSQAVTGPDVVQTLHELTGLKAIPTMDGESLLPLLKDPNAKLEREVMLMTSSRTSFGENIPEGVINRNRQAIEIDDMPMWTMIRSGRFKYVTYAGDGFEEIYDLENDPDEKNNLAYNPEYDALLKNLRQKTTSELLKTQSGFESGHFIDFFPRLKE